MKPQCMKRAPGPPLAKLAFAKPRRQHRAPTLRRRLASTVGIGPIDNNNNKDSSNNNISSNNKYDSQYC